MDRGFSATCSAPFSILMSPANRKAPALASQLSKKSWKNTVAALKRIIYARAEPACEFYCRWATARAPRAPPSRVQANTGENGYDRFENSGGGRRGGHPRIAQRDSLRRGLRRGNRGGREPGALLARRATAGFGAAGHLDARYRRHHPVARMVRDRRLRLSGGHDVRPWHGRDRRRGHAARRVRFRRKAAVADEIAAHRGAGARCRTPQTPLGTHSRVGAGRAHRQGKEYADAARTSAAGCRQFVAGAADRRIGFGPRGLRALLA